MTQAFSSKARAFVAIDSFEQDLRGSIRAHLLDHLTPSEVFGQELVELRQRRDADSGGTGGQITDYLYLRQAYDALLRHSQKLPRDLGDLLAVNVASLDVFVGVRNRVMHGRPLRNEDLETAYGFVTRFRSRYFVETAAVLRALDEDPAWQPGVVTQPAPYDRVLHNLPNADFDETGLVGRDREVRGVVDLLLRGRDRMITLTGEGGIGKTALALEACYSLVDAADPPFEAVLWVSLKNERLTADGIRSISDAVRDIAGATNELGRSLDASFGGSLDELADYLSGLRALIVIDNLESAQGSEVVALYDALPESVSFLFTSRVGIGQIERRLPIVGLGQNDAVLLLRKFASRRNQRELAALPQPTALDVVDRLRYSPLAIRWYVLSVETGKTPTDTLRNQTELLRFCVDNVYEALSPDARLVLAILRTLDRPISFDELAVVASLDIDTLRSASQTLAQGSLVVRTPAQDVGAADLLELSATARAYLPRVDDDSSVMSAVLDRESAYLRDREEARLVAAKRLLDPNAVLSRSPEDEPTAHLLRLALRMSRRRDWESAEAQIAKARTLNPGFHEVDRVHAFVASNKGNSPLAITRYKDALSQAKEEEDRARVSFFLAGHLARSAHDIESALTHATYAHTVLDNADTAMALGNFYIWEKNYQRGQELLEDALENTEVSKLKRIVTTALVDSWRRWGEDELTDQMPESAFSKGLAGVHTGKPLLLEGAHDARLVDSVVRAMTTATRALRIMSNPSPAQLPQFSADVQLLARDGRFRGSESWDRFEREYDMLDAGSKVKLTISPAMSLNSPHTPSGATETPLPLPVAPSGPGRYVGTIVTCRDSYAFIGHADFPHNVFFHFGALEHAGDRPLLRPGAVVEFSQEDDPDGRPRAARVSVRG